LKISEEDRKWQMTGKVPAPFVRLGKGRPVHQSLGEGGLATPKHRPRRTCRAFVPYYGTKAEFFDILIRLKGSVFRFLEN
jgi:hypothetical protein